MCIPCPPRENYKCSSNKGNSAPSLALRPETGGLPWASDLHKDVTSSCSGSLHFHGNCSINQDLSGEARGSRVPFPAHLPRLQLEPYLITQGLDPEVCFLSHSKYSAKALSPNIKPGNLWENPPLKGYNRAGFMLLLQVITPWSRVEGMGGEKSEFQEQHKLQKAQSRRCPSPREESPGETEAADGGWRGTKDPWKVRGNTSTNL